MVGSQQRDALICSGWGNGTDGAVSMDSFRGLAGAQTVAPDLVEHLWSGCSLHDPLDLHQGAALSALDIPCVSCKNCSCSPGIS